MKKAWLGLSALPLFLAMCSSSPGPSAQAGGSTAQRALGATAASVVQSANITNLYRENCAHCHGERGQGGGAGTRTLLTEEKFDQKHDRAFFDAIKNGVPEMGMEAFGGSLSDEQIWGLVVHIRELQARALRERTGSPRAQNGVFRTKRAGYRLETVIGEGQGLRTPWAIDWLSDGRMLVTNRPGALMVKDGDELKTVQGTPAVIELGQGGLLDVAVHPEHARNGWVYLAYAEPASGRRGGMTKIVRGKIEWRAGQPRWTSQQTIFEAAADSYTGAGVHFGSRIVFDGKGHLFFSIGDRGQQDLAQDLSKPNGKLFRLREDGSIPPDNPFRQPGQMQAVWSYGHRNAQGVAFDLEGNLWVTEHGPRGGDELNLIQKGRNYGWPLVAFSINYNDTPFRTPWPKQGQDIVLPVFRWLPSIGACGLDVVRGDAFPEWRGDLLAGGLSGTNVDRIRVRNGQLVEREEIVHGIARVRDVVVGPDGFVYLAFNDPDSVVRLVPAR
ncbi:MAG: PQQ-dependent sugar dehydrogenase [Fimbriimonadales bacterium]|nr:PQQ-dependent sugar dehydrogenase [Fimbriimonadales bacterium]